MRMVGSMLDQNKDGSSIDDLQRMAAKFFKYVRPNWKAYGELTCPRSYWTDPARAQPR